MVMLYPLCTKPRSTTRPGIQLILMCQVNWVLVSGFIAAIGTIANALLLLWMIRVTIRYVRVSEGNLDELRKQHLGLLSREIRPYLTLLERSIRNFEELQQKD